MNHGSDGLGCFRHVDVGAAAQAIGRGTRLGAEVACDVVVGWLPLDQLIRRWKMMMAPGPVRAAATSPVLFKVGRKVFIGDFFLEKSN